MTAANIVFGDTAGGIAGTGVGGHHRQE